MVKPVLKSGLLALIGGLFMLPAVICSAELPVQDVNLRTCLVEIGRKNGWSEPQQFHRIECHNRAIRSLQGLDAFQQIRILSLYNNALEDVQLKDFPHLEQLNLARNNLHHLQLSGLPALARLYFFDNRLKRVELTDLPALQEFKGSNNQLNAFHYAALPRLRKVYLFNNKLESIDINGFPSLEYMDVRENPMPDELYERMDALTGVLFLHDGNAEDW